METAKKEKVMHVIRSILIPATCVRWLWFITVEHIPKFAAWVTSVWEKLSVSEVGKWAGSFHLADTFLQPVGAALWRALLVFIPVLLAADWLIHKYSRKIGSQSGEKKSAGSHLSRLLIAASGVRWFWFLTVERMPKFEALITAEWQKLAAAPFGVWFGSFRLGEHLGFLQPALALLWRALLVVIPAALLTVRLALKKFPALRNSVERIVMTCSGVCRTVEGWVHVLAARIHSSHTTEKHTILRFLDPNCKEWVIDLGAIGKQGLTDTCSVAEDRARGVVVLTDLGRPENKQKEELKPGNWVTTTDHYMVQLLYTTV